MRRDKTIFFGKVTPRFATRRINSQMHTSMQVPQYGSLDHSRPFNLHVSISQDHTTSQTMIEEGSIPACNETEEFLLDRTCRPRYYARKTMSFPLPMKTPREPDMSAFRRIQRGRISKQSPPNHTLNTAARQVQAKSHRALDAPDRSTSQADFLEHRSQVSKQHYSSLSPKPLASTFVPITDFQSCAAAPGPAALHSFALWLTSLLTSCSAAAAAASTHTIDPTSDSNEKDSISSSATIRNLEMINTLLTVAPLIRDSGLDDYDGSGSGPHEVFTSLCFRFDETMLSLARAAWCPETSDPRLFDRALAAIERVLHGCDVDADADTDVDDENEDNGRKKYSKKAGAYAGMGMRCHLFTRSAGFMRDARRVARARIWDDVAWKVVGEKVPIELVRMLATELKDSDGCDDNEDGWASAEKTESSTNELDLRERYAPWPNVDSGRCRTLDCLESGFCVAGGCEGTTRSYWSMSRRRFFVMHGREICRFESCDGWRRHAEHGCDEWKIGGEDWFGNEQSGSGMKMLNRQRRVVQWRKSDECELLMDEECM